MADHRSCPRWQVNWRGQLKLEGSPEHACCDLRDINFKGVGVCLDEKLPVDTSVKLHLCLSQDCKFELEAWVAWHKHIEGRHMHGLYFTKIKDSDKESIHQFIQGYFKEQMRQKLREGISQTITPKPIGWFGVPPAAEGGEKMAEDRRIFERFPVTFPLRYLDLRQNREGGAKTADISAKGVSFVSNEELPPQTSLEIWIEIPDKGEPLYTRGEVVWSAPQGVNEYRVGVNLEKADLMGLSRVLRGM